MQFSDAEAFLQRCTQSTLRLAADALRSAVDNLRARGYQTKDFGITLGSGRPVPALKAILASHALIHTAEGEFYRDQLSKAAQQCGLDVLGIQERELYERASAHSPDAFGSTRAPRRRSRKASRTALDTGSEMRRVGRLAGPKRSAPRIFIRSALQKLTNHPETVPAKPSLTLVTTQSGNVQRRVTGPGGPGYNDV